jgi:hypothetical protein
MAVMQIEFLMPAWAGKYVDTRGQISNPFSQDDGN